MRLTKDIRAVIDNLPILLGDREPRYTALINGFIEQCRNFDIATLLARLRRPGVQPAHLEYVLSTYMNPSMPDLHFSNVNQRFMVNGQQVTLERGLEFLQGMLRGCRAVSRARGCPTSWSTRC